MKLRPRRKKVAKKPGTRRPNNLSKRGVVKWILDGAIEVPHDRLKTPCLDPNLTKGSKGYPQVGFKGKYCLAHRLVYEVMHGPIGEGLLVLHSCDRKFCIAPSHLHTGTHQDNTNEMMERGRDRQPDTRGERNGNTWLTEGDIKQIRKLAAKGMVQRKIALRFGISQRNVSRIVLRQIWGHVRD